MKSLYASDIQDTVMLHSLDDLDGKIQAIQSLPHKESGSKWTAFHRAYGFYRRSGDGYEVN